MKARLRLSRPVALREAAAGGVVLVWLLAVAALAGAGSPAGTGAVPATCSISAPGVTRPAACQARLAFTPLRTTGTTIEAAGGLRIPAVPGRVASFVDQSYRAGSASAPYAEISGWAASPTLHRPADVLVFVGGRYLGAVAPTVDRGDVARSLRDPGLRKVGYTVDIPMRLLGGQRARSLRLYAAAGKLASPIAIDCARLPPQLGC